MRPPERLVSESQQFCDSIRHAQVANITDGHTLNNDPAEGWYRELRPCRLRDGQEYCAYYYSPDGTQLKSRAMVRRFLTAHPDVAKVSDSEQNELELDMVVSMAPAPGHVPRRRRRGRMRVNTSREGAVPVSRRRRAAQVGDRTLDSQNDFQFVYGKVPSSEIARCKQLNRTAINREIEKLWKALADDERSAYAKKAEGLNSEAADARNAATLAEAGAPTKGRRKRVAIERFNGDAFVGARSAIMKSCPACSAKIDACYKTCPSCGNCALLQERRPGDPRGPIGPTP